jgi:hypothetical protein
MNETTTILDQPTCTVPEAGRVLGISRESAYRAACDGSLPVIQLGRRKVVPVARLRELLGLPPHQ